MSAPQVVVKETDLSTRVPSFPGVYGAIVIPAPKGPVDEPMLITNEADLLKYFTPDETVKIGYSTAFYSALAFLRKSNKLWVVRAANSPLYGGATVAANADIDGNLVSGEATGTLTAGLSDPTTYTFVLDELFLIYGANPGTWNNDIGVKVITTDVKEPDAFIIEVYKRSNPNVPVEVWTVSRIPGKKDGYGRNIYIEDALQGSLYIRALDNIAVDSSIMPVESTSIIWLGGGSDGNAVTDADMIRALHTLDSKDTYPVTLVIDGGWTTPAYHNELTLFCETRKDCFAILSVPYVNEASASYLNDIVNYRNVDLNANTSYAAMYTPHVLIYDKFNDRKIYVSPDGFVAGIISETASNYEIWYPPAGLRRGQIRVLDVRRRFTQGEMDYLYDNGINPIRFAIGKGITVWGQKTLLTRPSSLDRINVRLLLIVIENAIAEALEDFVFEINDANTRALIRAMIESYLSNIQARRGLYDYYVVCDETNNTQQDIDNYKLNVWVFVQPVKSAEYIQLNTIITRTGVSFQEVIGNV